MEIFSGFFLLTVGDMTFYFLLAVSAKSKGGGWKKTASQ